MTARCLTDFGQLLRKFHDIMLSGSIEDGEECSICMTQMEVGKAYRYTYTLLC